MSYSKLVDDIIVRILFCSILSGLFLSLVVLFFTSYDLFSFVYIIFYWVIFAVIYLFTGAPIQYLLNKRPGKFSIIYFLIYLIVGTIVNSISFIIVSDIEQFYLTTIFHFMILSSSVIFWFMDSTFLQNRK
ncbi:UPF0715 family protein [Peribacillus sp. JNUCC 23]